MMTSTNYVMTQIVEPDYKYIVWGQIHSRWYFRMYAIRFEFKIIITRYVISKIK